MHDSDSSCCDTFVYCLVFRFDFVCFLQVRFLSIHFSKASAGGEFCLQQWPFFWFPSPLAVTVKSETCCHLLLPPRKAEDEVALLAPWGCFCQVSSEEWSLCVSSVSRSSSPPVVFAQDVCGFCPDRCYNRHLPSPCTQSCSQSQGGMLLFVCCSGFPQVPLRPWSTETEAAAWDGLCVGGQPSACLQLLQTCLVGSELCRKLICKCTVSFTVGQSYSMQANTEFGGLSLDWLREICYNRAGLDANNPFSS